MNPDPSHPPKAMMLAAGLGSRLKPWTDAHPKALAPVNGKPLLQRNVEYLQRFGIRDVIVNVHHFAEQVKEAIDASQGWGSRITISDETDEVLETGGGLQKAAPYLNGDAFVLMNTDVLTDLDLAAMIESHRHSGVLATLAVSDRETSRYFLFNQRDILCGWRNVKTGAEKIARTDYPLHQKAFSGIHVISPAIFSRIPFTGKFSMVDLYLALSPNNDIKAFDHSGAKFIDVGKPESIAMAEQLFH